MGRCQLEPQLELVVKRACFCTEVGEVSHEQLATRDHGGKEEREAQCQQRLQEGAEKSNNGVIICSRIWKHGVKNFNVK